jgi:hypothetical protein
MLAAGIIFLLSGCKTLKLECSSFNHQNSKVGISGSNYLLLNDGSKVFGNEIKSAWGILTKDKVVIDGKLFLIKDVQGYYQDGIYYGRLGMDYIKRIIDGKLSLYSVEERVGVTNVVVNGIDGISLSVCSFYITNTPNGQMKKIKTIEDIRKYLLSCPKALDALKKTDKEIKSSIQGDISFLNSVIETFNNGCL